VFPVLTFGGLRFARGPLTLGQRTVLARQPGGCPCVIERAVPVPPGTDVADVWLAVQAVVCRHETLRTRFPAGDREQVVDGAGTLPIRMCDSVGEARAELTEKPFDVVGEWGIRVAVVCRDERPRVVLLCLSPLAVDTWAADLVVEDLHALLRGVDRPPPVMQPLEQAAAESTSDDLAHLRETLLTAPPEQAVADPDGWSFGELRSTVVDPAARAVAARCQATAAAVYLAAAAVGLGAGQRVLTTITPNRGTPAATTCVAPFALDVFVPVDASEEKFDSVVARTWDAYRAASRHTRHDPAAVRRLVDEVAAERGVRPDLSVRVDDFRASARPRPGAGATTFRWREPCRPPGLTRYVAIADDGAAVTLSLLANRVALPGERVRAFLHDMERLIVAAADGESLVDA
jgi:hypothetical protein